MKALNDLNIFVETARQGSFSKAANSMDMTPAAISASIKRLEGQIGFPLFVRSTRSLRLTSEGELFLDKTTQALATLQEGLDQISSARGELSGQLHITAPSDFGRNMLLDWVDEFIDLYPNVSIKLELSDSLTDMYTKLSILRFATASRPTPIWSCWLCVGQTNGSYVHRQST